MPDVFAAAIGRVIYARNVRRVTRISLGAMDPPVNNR